MLLDYLPTQTGGVELGADEDEEAVVVAVVDTNVEEADTAEEAGEKDDADDVEEDTHSVRSGGTVSGVRTGCCCCFFHCCMSLRDGTLKVGRVRLLGALTAAGNAEEVCVAEVVEDRSASEERFPGTREGGGCVISSTFSVGYGVSRAVGVCVCVCVCV
jgi:hypothetical protein